MVRRITELETVAKDITGSPEMTPEFKAAFERAVKRFMFQSPLWDEHFPRLWAAFETAGPFDEVVFTMTFKFVGGDKIMMPLLAQEVARDKMHPKGCLCSICSTVA